MICGGGKDVGWRGRRCWLRLLSFGLFTPERGAFLRERRHDWCGSGGSTHDTLAFMVGDGCLDIVEQLTNPHRELCWAGDWRVEWRAVCQLSYIQGCTYPSFPQQKDLFLRDRL